MINMHEDLIRLLKESFDMAREKSYSDFFVYDAFDEFYEDMEYKITKFLVQYDNQDERVD